MKKITITLKQHTPLLHFQSMQEGATLRASEVKPRLDKFLLTELGKEQKAIGKYNDAESDYHAGCIAAKKNGWLIGASSNDDSLPSKEKRALNYRMKISAKTEDKINTELSVSTSKILQKSTQKLVWMNIERDFQGQEKQRNFPLQLSNMAGKEDKEDLINFSFYKKVIINIQSRNEEITTFLNKHLCKFFAKYNFGQRANKGFGSFSINKLDYNNVIKRVNFDENILYKNEKPYLLEIYTTGTSLDYKACKEVFNTIDYFYKCLKSGINYNCTSRDINKCSRENLLKTESDLSIENKHNYVCVQNRRDIGKLYCHEDDYYNCQHRIYKKSFLYKYLNDYNNCNWEKRAIKTTFGLGEKHPITENNREAKFGRAVLGLPNDFKYGNKIVSISNNANIDRIASPIYFKPIIFEMENGYTIYNVYIFIDDSHINEISNNAIFNFSMNGRRENIELGITQVDYNDLIEKFVNSFSNTCFKPIDFSQKPILSKCHEYVNIYKVE